MSKDVVRTSLFWMAVIAIAGLVIAFRFRRPPLPEPESVSVRPVAAGPASAQPGVANSSVRGAPAALTPVQVSPERMQSIGVTTAVVERGPVAYAIRATGTVDIDQRLLSYVQVRFSGYLRKVFANAPLQFVKKGDPLFTIYSPDLVAAENDYLVALRNRGRLQASALDGVAADASALVSAAEARLRQWNVEESTIRQVRETGAPVAEMLVTAPASGYITERNAFPNLYVEPATRLYTIAGLTRVWVNAQLFPEDLGRIKAAAPAEITVDAYPGRIFRGRVETVLPQVDMTTRTGLVRIALANPGLLLEPGMYVNVGLTVGLGTQTTTPANAVLVTGERSVAFLYRGDGRLVPQLVEPGPRVGDRIIVLKGLLPGQRVVSSANFLVDSESQLQAAMGAFEPPPPGAGPRPQTGAGPLTIDFSSIPSPPQKGRNRFRVHLTDAQGRPVSQAAVMVTFYMAAMPAMGMGAMTSKSELQPAGPGLYEGSGVLESGGTWQVTITVRRNDAVIANKQTSVTATGSM